MADGNFVAYYRTSTRTQDLGIEAQKATVISWLNGGKHQVIGEFEEHESGKNDERKQLQAAITLCKKRKATLVIAKMDRLSRDLAFIANLMKSGVEFVACDNPHANKLTIHILAAVAEHERDMIAKRTSEALQALKRSGKRLGSPEIEKAQAKSREVRTVKADQFAANVLPVIEKLKAQGFTTLRAIASELNERNVKTSRGGEWSAKQVQLVIERGHRA
ncbi:recombinase family protein [Microvirga sp. VF16]|uniref:recombinase family protein n=1 Tax=Microvirga sp. VF16 TaxID=2807101 RepID=UPI00193D2265|nr:recombinase family protein [Microvirga sp. VF16]QRM29558.1 recombinase family protein [Microvirga sp. VF16]